MWTVHTARGVAGTITDTGNGLVASPQSLQSMADVAARRGAAAYLDGYSNGYVWTEPSGHTVKAAAAGGGEDDPKAPVTGPAGQPVPPAPPTAAAWPGWVYDLTLASVYTDQVTQAFRAATTQAGHLLRDWWAGRVAATRAGLVDLISDLVGGHVGATLRRLWTEAWYLGHRSARGVAREEGPDWGTWTPGDFEAAQIVATAHGLQTLLAAHGVTTIRAIAQTRMQALASEISDAVEHGDSWESLAARMEQILRVPQRAPMIARTEIARAVSAATVDQYRDHGVARAEWAVAPDERVCPVCRKNEAAGAVPAGSLFPSGNESPPAHPNCRCALIPAEVHGFDITGPWPEPVAKSGVLIKGTAWMHELRGPHGEWITGGRVPIYTGREVTEGDTITRPDGGTGTVRMVDPDDGIISVDRGSPYSAVESYHYDPGGTRTKTHTAELSDQAENAATLNAGGDLDQSSPAARALVDGITFWATGGRDPGWDDSFPADIALAAAVDQAPSNAPPLYRGLYGSADETPELGHLAEAKPGFRFHTGMASWSASEDVGRMFAGDQDDTTGGVAGRDWGDAATKVLLKVDPGAKALGIEQYAAEFANQHEWVTGGDFEVTGTTTEPGGMVVVSVKRVPDES